MTSIKHLPKDVSSRIAAGEVIENPASVVKELLENSLDAGASRIVVTVLNGGKNLIAVEDDGEGIIFNELPLAVERFATSKIREIEDLLRIGSLGFRGEALASVCTVSRMEIRSHRSGSNMGGILRTEGGNILLHTPITAQSGTRVEVADLFYNLPARRKFLKSATSELRRTASIVREYSAAFPEISFSLFSEGKEIFSTDGKDKRVSVLKKIWGFAQEPRQGSLRTGEVLVEAVWAAIPGSRRRDTILFFNQRRVRDSAVLAAISSCGEGASGYWFFNISVPKELIDVNIHPGKAEVRVHSSLPLFESVRKVVISLVEGTDLDPALFLKEEASHVRRTGTGSYRSVNIGSPDQPGFFTRVGEPPYPLSQVVPENGNYDKSFSFIGQTASGYLIFDTVDEIVLVDPHAAHERVVYERLVERSSGKVPQLLPFPEQIPPALSEFASEYREDLEAIGFKFEKKEGALFLVACPEGYGSISAADPMGSLRFWAGSIERSHDDPEKEIPFALEACHSSVRLGERITPEEASRLFDDLLSCENPAMCPHGRPTMVRLRSTALSRLFGRDK